MPIRVRDTAKVLGVLWKMIERTPPQKEKSELNTLLSNRSDRYSTAVAPIRHTPPHSCRVAGQTTQAIKAAHASASILPNAPPLHQSLAQKGKSAVQAACKFTRPLICLEEHILQPRFPHTMMVLLFLSCRVPQLLLSHLICLYTCGAQKSRISSGGKI